MPAINDQVRLKLAGIEVPIAIDYQVDAGVLEVPAAFQITVGHSGLIAELASAFPPFTPFELFVGDVRVQTGETDGYSIGGSGGSSISIMGRDMLKWLVDTQVRDDRTFAEKTFFQLVDQAITECSLENILISLSDVAHRKAITGTQKGKKLNPNKGNTTEVEITEAGKVGSKTVVYQTATAKVGTTWWDFIAEQLRRAGLFLWSDVEGAFILSRPDGNQQPLYRLVRRRSDNGEAGEVTVLGPPTFDHDTRRRFTECQVFGRGGGGAAGRTKVEARHYDDEMIALLNPLKENRLKGGKRQKPLIIKDSQVRTVEQAQFLAKRKIVESRRNGWRLSYTVQGHTTPALRGGGMLVWAPNTVVEVIDDDLGIEGPMYVESVVFRRKPETTTQINLLRCEDLVFSEEDFETRKKGGGNALQKKRAGISTLDPVDIVINPLDFTKFWRSDPNWDRNSPDRLSFRSQS